MNLDLSSLNMEKTLSNPGHYHYVRDLFNMIHDYRMQSLDPSWMRI